MTILGLTGGIASGRHRLDLVLLLGGELDPDAPQSGKTLRRIVQSLAEHQGGRLQIGAHTRGQIYGRTLRAFKLLPGDIAESEHVRGHLPQNIIVVESRDRLQLPGHVLQLLRSEPSRRTHRPQGGLDLADRLCAFPSRRNGGGNQSGKGSGDRRRDHRPGIG